MRKVLVPILLLTFASCDGALQSTRQVVETTASAINDEFVTVRAAQQTFVGQVFDLYGRVEGLDLSVEGMDASEGGLYETFPDNKYYYKVRHEGSALYLSPGRPVDGATRRQVKFMEYVDPFLQKAGTVSPYQVVAFYGVITPVSIALLSPWIDVVSVFPPGLHMENFEWYQRGLQSPGSPVWSTQPFRDLATGWVVDVSSPVRLGTETKGVAVSSVNLAKLAQDFVRGRPEALLLMGSDTTVVGISVSAQTLLKIKGLENPDYYKQEKTNSIVPGEYRLTDPSQTAVLQQLGRSLVEDDFSFSIDGKPYWVVRRIVPENGMAVVGFTPR